MSTLKQAERAVLAAAAAWRAALHDPNVDYVGLDAASDTLDAAVRAVEAVRSSPVRLVALHAMFADSGAENVADTTP